MHYFFYHTEELGHNARCAQQNWGDNWQTNILLHHIYVPFLRLYSQVTQIHIFESIQEIEAAAAAIICGAMAAIRGHSPVASFYKSGNLLKTDAASHNDRANFII